MRNCVKVKATNVCTSLLVLSWQLKSSVTLKYCASLKYLNSQRNEILATFRFSEDFFVFFRRYLITRLGNGKEIHRIKIKSFRQQ
jgi:hypothetical protein